VKKIGLQFWNGFFFFYGPPWVPRCRRSPGKVRPLKLVPAHQSERRILLLVWNGTPNLCKVNTVVLSRC
jgi:hypothetical protein